MPRQRTAENSRDYSRATIEDRPEEVDNSISITNSDGSTVDVGTSNPLPVVDSLRDYQEATEVNQLLKIMIEEQKKTNLYLAEMMGDTFDESR